MIIRFADYYEEEIINVICDKMLIRQINGIIYYTCLNKEGEVINRKNTNIYHIIEIISI